MKQKEHATNEKSMRIRVMSMSIQVNEDKSNEHEYTMS